MKNFIYLLVFSLALLITNNAKDSVNYSVENDVNICENIDIVNDTEFNSDYQMCDNSIDQKSQLVYNCDCDNYNVINTKSLKQRIVYIKHSLIINNHEVSNLNNKYNKLGYSQRMLNNTINKNKLIV